MLIKGDNGRDVNSGDQYTSDLKTNTLSAVVAIVSMKTHSTIISVNWLEMMVRVQAHPFETSGVRRESTMKLSII